MSASACIPFLTGPIWVDTTFSGELPRRRLAEPSLEVAEAARFTQYLTGSLMFHRREQDAQCRNSWAFVLTGALLHATQLAYRRFDDVIFEGRHLSVEYLTTCYESPGRLCGCYGADLCAALAATALHGMVTYRQSPYVASTDAQKPDSAIDVAYYCFSTAHLDTCPPCAPSQADYVERLVPASASEGGARFTVSCYPCNQAKSPRYYPYAPFHLFDPSWSHAERVASVKAELRRIGPLAAALPVDDEALQELLPGQQLVAQPEQGIVYRPARLRVDSYHSALIVGYVDEAPETAVWICRSSWVEVPWFGYAMEVPDAGDEGEAPHLGVIDRMFNVRMYDDPGATLVDRVVSFAEVRIRTAADEAPRALSPADPLLRARRATAPARRRGPRHWPELLLVAVLAVSFCCLWLFWR